MKNKVTWWGSGAAVAVIAVVVVLLVRGGGDDNDDPGSAAPTASASLPVTTPSPLKTTAAPTTPAAPTAAPKPVDLDETATIDRGAKAKIVTIKSVTSKAEGPGEISGPAIQVTMRITAGDKDVDLKDVVVNGYYGSDLRPAIVVAKPGGKPFAGVLSSGNETTGVYVFNVPAAKRKDVTIEMYFSSSKPPALFTGSAR